MQSIGSSSTSQHFIEFGPEHILNLFILDGLVVGSERNALIWFCCVILPELAKETGLFGIFSKNDVSSSLFEFVLLRRKRSRKRRPPRYSIVMKENLRAFEVAFDDRDDLKPCRVDLVTCILLKPAVRDRGRVKPLGFYNDIRFLDSFLDTIARVRISK